jgi:subtilisin family serine protease
VSTTGGNGTPDIAVVDTGVPQDWKNHHAELVDTIQEVGDWVDLVDFPADGVRDHQAGHGMFIAGLVSRLAPHLDIQVIKTLSTTGETDDASLSVALDKVTAPVINLSLGGYTVDNLPSVALDQMIKKLVDQGRIVVAAAGNAGGATPGTPFHNRPFWPASLAYPGVVSVGAVDTKGALTLWPETNVGAIYAPGVDLWSTFIVGLNSFVGWAAWTGTSFATPVVAARIAELIAAPHAGTAVDLVEDWKNTELTDTDPSWTNIDPAKVYLPKVNLTKW